MKIYNINYYNSNLFKYPKSAVNFGHAIEPEIFYDKKKHLKKIKFPNPVGLKDVCEILTKPENFFSLRSFNLKQSELNNLKTSKLADIKIKELLGHGSVAVQYAKRYIVTTALQMEAAKKDFDKIRKRALKQVKNFNVPEIVYKEIDKCKVEEEPKEIVPVSDIKKTEEPVIQEESILEESTQEEQADRTEENTEVQSEEIIDETTDTTKEQEKIINEEKKANEVIDTTENEKSAKEEMKEMKEEALDAEENTIEQKTEQQKNKTTEDKQNLVEDKPVAEEAEERIYNEYKEPEIAKPDDIKDNIKDAPDKTEDTPEYSPIQIEEYTHSATYETTKVKSEKNLKPAKQKKQKKVSAKKRAKEAAKKLAQ